VFEEKFLPMRRENTIRRCRAHVVSSVTPGIVGMRALLVGDATLIVKSTTQARSIERDALSNAYSASTFIDHLT
jgi:hypothetical protein